MRSGWAKEEDRMVLDAHGKRIVQCAMELLNVNEELFDLSKGVLTEAEQLRFAALELRRIALLAKVGVTSGMERRADQSHK
jgi:hypothetical protein